MFDTIGLNAIGSPAQCRISVIGGGTQDGRSALDGWLQVDDDLIVGPQQSGFFDEAGKLSVASTGALEVLDRIELASRCVLEINLDPAASANA